MSKCPYCRTELPGLQTLCQECWEKRSASPDPPRPWPPRSLPRLTKGNIFGFLFVFGYAFLRWRFTSYHPPTTLNSALIALVFASIGIYFLGER